MGKFLVQIFLVGILVAIVVPIPQVQAANLKTIKSTVTKQVEVRQQTLQPPDSSPAAMVEPVSEKKAKSAKPAETKTYWSLFDGKIKYHSINGQHYLSFFARD